MLYKNPNSKRENLFRRIYDNDEFKNILKNKDKQEFPFFIDVELTNNCNLKCLFCGQQTMKREKGFIDEKTFKKIVDECSQYKSPIRLIRWGEPFLHPKIIDFCKYAKQEEIQLHITTNGTIINEQQMQEIVDLQLDSIIFSFQGATKEQYELMRNNKLYDKLKNNILKLIEIRGDKQKPYIHISTTITDETEEQINNFKKYWGGIVDSVDVGKTNFSLLSANQIKSLELINKLNWLKKQETIKREYRPCTEVHQKLSVNWDGKVTCCCGDFDNFLIVGNLNDSTLKNIWDNSESLKAFRKLLDMRKHGSLSLCKNCYLAYEEFN
jgi:MoaA/NifB/PqqE/SkfB family radical SAM enzyme